MSNWKNGAGMALALAAGLAVTWPATAQNTVDWGAQALVGIEEVPDVNVEISVDRDALDLQEHIRVRVYDPDVVDTAMVFTSTRHGVLVVRCTAWDDRGRIVGRVRVKVPSRGLRYVRARDIGHGRDFIGSAMCSTGGGGLLGSVVLVGGEFSDLRVVQSDGERGSLIRFPLIATF